MTDLLDAAPIVAAGFAVPQFLPQIRKLLTTRDMAGVSPSWAALGTLLTAAFLLQVMPSLWTAYRTPRPTGISSGTWLLILGELTCWLTFGLHTADPRLITLGTSGIIVSTLMLARIHRTARSADRFPGSVGRRPARFTVVGGRANAAQR